MDQPPRRPLSDLVLALRPGSREEALAFFDRVEGTASGHYRRVVATTDAGRHAWAYEFTGPVDGFVDLDGRWTGV